MKKLLALSPAKIFIICGFGLLMTMGGFWHYQMNQTQLDRINVLNQGVGTCFNRISQTFTAMMIRDVQSPYLHQGFMALSDECLTETVNGINPFRKNVGKGYDTLNQLISETHWFHEKIHKLNVPALAGVAEAAPVNLAPVQERFSRMEEYKVSLVDEIESTNARIRSVQRSDEILMGVGLLLFVLSISVLSLQEFNRIQLKREIESLALGHLKAGNASVAALVDQLVDRALRTQGMPVTAQVFQDYHGQLMERMAGSVSEDVTPVSSANVEAAATAEASAETMDTEVMGPRASLKEVVVTLQNIHGERLQVNDLRDVELLASTENLEQIINCAINKFTAASGTENRKVMLTNQVHSDRTVISLFTPGAELSAGEVEYASGGNAEAEGMDMNMILLKEMVTHESVKWHAENKTDKSGKVTGMNMRFVVNRAPKMRKNLVSVIRGRKKDIAREMMN